MKKIISLTSNLILSSTLVLGVTMASADEAIVKTPFDLPGYCHIQFPEMVPDTLNWDRPVLDENGAKVDFYGPCDHDPTGADAVKSQRRVMMHGFYGDGE